MLLTVRDDFARYRIECPPGCEVRPDYEGTDFLVVPDPDDPEVPYWLWDDLLLTAASSEDFGLRLLSVEPLN
jgi:hypothetical protein